MNINGITAKNRTRRLQCKLYTRKIGPTNGRKYVGWSANSVVITRKLKYILLLFLFCTRQELIKFVCNKPATATCITLNKQNCPRDRCGFIFVSYILIINNKTTKLKQIPGRKSVPNAFCKFISVAVQVPDGTSIIIYGEQHCFREKVRIN